MVDPLGLKCVLRLSHVKKAPRGVTGEFRALIYDERVEWTYRDKFSTMILASEMSRKNTREEKITFDIKRGIAITEYPGMTQEAIKEKLTKELQAFENKN